MPEKKQEISSNCQQHVDQVNGSCYGKQNLYKIYGRDEYRGICQHECRLKEVCINASRENRENVNRELCIAQGLDAGNLAQDNSGTGYDFIIEHLGVPEGCRAEFIECVRRLSGIYLNTPQIFELMMKRIYHGMNQAELARLRGVTRQAVSSQTLKNYAGIMKDLMPELPKCLTDVTERTIYMLLYVDKCSIREASKRSGLEATKIFRVKQRIASKLAKNATVKKTKMKKIEK